MKRLLLLSLFLILSSFYVSAQTYELVPSFSAGAGPDNEINAMGVDSNGDIIIGGDFLNYNGTGRQFLARINEDGTLDGGFAPGVAMTSSVYDLVVHSNGSVTLAWAGGVRRFDNIGGTDGTFSTGAINNIVDVVAGESTGLVVYAGGNFTDIGGTSVGRLAKLDADGSLNIAFNTNMGTGFNGRVRAIAVSSSGKILVSGDFTSFAGVTRNKVALLNSDGTLDTNFNPSTTLSNDVAVEAVAFQDDGKLLVGSYSTSLGRGRLHRFATDGTTGFATSITGAFNLGALGIGDIISNGTDDILVAIQSAGGIVSLDYTTGVVVDIRTGNGIGGGTAAVNAMVKLSDGSIVLGGDFTHYNAISVNDLAKIATCTVSIDTEPENATACETNNTAFTVVASGSGTLLYQWQESTDSFNYSDIADAGVYSGATTAALTITGATSGMSGNYYRCIVTDDDCSSTTSVSTLTVTPTQFISLQPMDYTSCQGLTNAGFTVTISGTTDGYQWQEDTGSGVFADLVDGSEYSGVNTNALTIFDPAVDMSGYKYRVKNTACDPGGLFSTAATLNINEAPVITQAPVDFAVCVSGDASFTVAATSSNMITYQWQYHNGSAWTNLSDAGKYSGVNTTTLSITNVDNTLVEFNGATGDKIGVSIRCLVTSNGCEVNTGEDRLYVHIEPTITTQPKDYVQCVNAGDVRSTTFFPFITFSDSGLPFQWEFDDGTGFVSINDNAVYSGTDKRVLTLTDANATYNGLYRVKISNCAATVYTDDASFTLDEKAVLIAVSEISVEICAGADAEFEISSSDNQVTYQWQMRFSGSAFSNIADNANFSGTSNSVLQIIDAPSNFNLSTYRCMATRGTCTVNSSQFTLRVNNIPSFSSTITDRTACEDLGTAVFSKSASNFKFTFHTYQWQEAAAGSDIFTDISDGETFSGTTGASLTVSAPAYIMNGNRYRNSVIGCEAPVYSNPATLTVNQLPLVTTSPESQSVCHGESVTFTAQSAIGTDVTYQWMVDRGSGYTSASNNAPAGSDGFSTLSFTARADDNGFKYKCVARGATPCSFSILSESFEATLTVNQIQLTTGIPNVVICNDENTTFTIDVLGDGLTYQWQINNTDLTEEGIYTGTNTTTLTITGANNIAIGQSNTFKCIVSNTCGEVSTTANLQVLGTTKPEIFADFNNAEAPTLSVTNVSGDSYEWFLDGTSLGSGNNSLTIDQAGSYTVIVSINGCPSEMSDAQVVIVTGFKKEAFEGVVSLFPNPVRNQLTVTLDELDKNTEIRVLSLDGKVRKSHPVVGRINTIDMRNLSVGIYIVEVLNNNKKRTYKIIKE